MLKLEFIGNLGQDAKQTNLNDGKSVLNYSVAIYNGKDKEGKDRPATWISCQHYFKDTDPKICQYLKKGTKIFITGRPKVESYINNENKSAAALVCVVEGLELLSASTNE
jgi:single stranded DNA-binding protein